MSILDFPMPLLPVIGCREHRIFDTEDIDPALPREERQRSIARDRYERNRDQILADKKRQREDPEYRARQRAYQASYRAQHVDELRAYYRARAAKRYAMASAEKQAHEARAQVRK